MSVLEKSPDAFRTISEVAEDLDVPQHVLRFWETKFSQIKPLKRAGGRRYYRPDDVDLLRGIKTLLYADGFTIKGVQRVFRDQGLRYVVETGRMAAQQAGAAGDDRPMAVTRTSSHSATGTISGAVQQHQPAPDPEPAAETKSEPEPEPEEDLEAGLSDEQRAALNEILSELEGLRTRLSNARTTTVRVADTAADRKEHALS